MNYKRYIDLFFDPMTTYFSKLIQAYPAPIAKINFFMLMWSILLAFILSVNGYFAGLFVLILLFFLVSLMRAVKQEFTLFLCEAVLLLGLALHCTGLNFSLAIGLLALLGFLLLPLLEKEMHTHFYIPPFDLRMTLFMLALILNLGILLLLFYALFLNGQILWRLFRSAH